MSETLAPAAPANDARAALPPLVQRLMSERAYPYVDDAVEAAALNMRDHLLFLPAHGKGHLETPDIAVVLPELVSALGGEARLGAAVAGPKLEAALRDEMSLALPALVVLRAGKPTGAVARMRDWDEYLERLAALLSAPTPQTH